MGLQVDKLLLKLFWIDINKNEIYKIQFTIIIRKIDLYFFIKNSKIVSIKSVKTSFNILLFNYYQFCVSYSIFLF